MTIQLSITVWTIICFFLLTVILKNLLFKPVLSVMDKRQARIDAANAKKAEHERLVAEHEKNLEEKRAELEAQQKKQIKEKVESIRQDSKKAVEDARRARMREVEDYRAKNDTDRTEILYDLSTHTTELARLFADRLV